MGSSSIRMQMASKNYCGMSTGAFVRQTAQVLKREVAASEAAQIWL